MMYCCGTLNTLTALCRTTVSASMALLNSRYVFAEQCLCTAIMTSIWYVLLDFASSHNICSFCVYIQLTKLHRINLDAFEYAVSEELHVAGQGASLSAHLQSV